MGEPASRREPVSVCEPTETYLDAVYRCVAELRAVVDHPPDGAAARAAADRVAARESECDAARRDLTATLAAELPPRPGNGYLYAADLVPVVATVDDVANAAEAFAREFTAVHPETTPATAAALAEMATLAATATRHLGDLTVAVVAGLAEVGADPDVVGPVNRIRDLEGRCDELKYDAVADAFEAQSAADALVVRECVLGLDAVVNAVEDAADRLVYVDAAAV